MQTAWRERNPQERIRAAKAAIEKNPDCATAYILLAEEEALTITDSEKLLKQALKAAETNLKKSQLTQIHQPGSDSLHSKKSCLRYSGALNQNNAMILLVFRKRY